MEGIEETLMLEEEETGFLAPGFSATSTVASATVVKAPIVNTTSSEGRLFGVESLLSTFLLIVFNVTVIVGNSMVILAVFTHKKLRPTTTNSFIVSLAAADLMVGIAVLPFSSTNQARTPPSHTHSHAHRGEKQETRRTSLEGTDGEALRRRRGRGQVASAPIISGKVPVIGQVGAGEMLNKPF